MFSEFESNEWLHKLCRFYFIFQLLIFLYLLRVGEVKILILDVIILQ